MVAKIGASQAAAFHHKVLLPHGLINTQQLPFQALRPGANILCGPQQQSPCTNFQTKTFSSS